MSTKSAENQPEKLYLATVEVDVYMMASSKEEAERDAMRHIEEEMRFGGGDLLPHVREIRHKPRHLLWDRKSLVYGAGSDRSLGDVVDQLPEEPGR